MNSIKETFSTFFNEQLNKPQQQAVEPRDGTLLVIAGAGSGKTRVITARIINLIVNYDVDPTSILALTFTNKAANEMKERVRNFLPKGTPLPYIGTFHSYCLYLLKRNAHLLDYPEFSILDAEDQEKLIKSIIKRNGLDKQIAPKTVLYTISNIKNSLQTSSLHDHPNAQLITDLYHAYEKEKLDSKCFDFDDLLVTVYKLLEKNNDFKQEHQNKVKHVLIDEYQDTNVIQHGLLKQITLTPTQNKKSALAVDSVCAVGDEDQSIYSWRGATVANILNFKKDFPNATVVTIEQNYRSAEPILTVANTVIEHNLKRNPKNLWSAKKATDRVRVVRCLSGYQEGDVLVQMLTALHPSIHPTLPSAASGTQDEREKRIEGQSLKDYAFLYRAHHQSRMLEEALIRASIPYKIIGGIQFYERKEIKDMLAYLRLMVNPFDRIALLRVLNTPQRGLGPKVEEQIIERWQQEPLLTFTALLEQLIAEHAVPPLKASALKQFIEVFKEYDQQAKPSVALNHIITQAHYFTFLKKQHDQEEANIRIENVKELIRATKHFEEQGTVTIEQFLHEVALMQEHINADKDKTDYVQLMTIHAAKGLEFHTVALTGLEDGVFPSTHSLYEKDKLEEERRLFYVGITRACERLLLSTARYRMSYGQMNEQMPSRFLREIPEQLAPHFDASQCSKFDIAQYFNEWLNNAVRMDLTPSSVHLTRGPQKMASNAQLEYFYDTKNVSKEKAPQKKTIKPSKKIELNTHWKKNQPVKHAKYGIGIIKEIDQKNGDYFLSIQFKDGVKKIKDSFVTKA